MNKLYNNPKDNTIVGVKSKEKVFGKRLWSYPKQIN